MPALLGLGYLVAGVIVGISLLSSAIKIVREYQRVVVFRLGRHFVAASDLPDGNAMLGFIEFCHQLVQQCANLLARLLERGGELGERKRLFGHVNTFPDVYHQR